MTGYPLLDLCIGTVAFVTAIVSLLTALNAHAQIKRDREKSRKELG